jgi:chromosome segregation ATPase
MRQKQDLEEKHAFELKVYKQKVKHLLHEMQSHMTDVRIDGQVHLKLLQDDTRGTQHELKSNIRQIKMQKKRMELAHMDLVRNLKLATEMQVMTTRQDYERKAEELKQSYEKKMKTVQNRCNAERKKEILIIEHRKTEFIKQIMEEHKSKFTKIKDYYYGITRANLDAIKSLKEDVAAMKKIEKGLKKELSNKKREHERLHKPLDRNRRLVVKLTADLETFEKDQKQLEEKKAKLAKLAEKHKNLSWEQEIMQQKTSQLTAEKDTLENKLETTIYSIQQKTGFKNLVLEKKLEAMQIDLQNTEAALAEVIASTNLSQGGGVEVKNSLEEVLMAKNQMVQRLERTLAELKQKYHEAIVKYENKLGEYNIPVSELGFTPIKRF